MNDPVNDPVLTVNVIEVAADAVVAKEAVGGVNVIDVAAEAVVATEEEIATLAVPKVDPLCVPINDPVNEPVLTANVIEVAALDVAAKEDDSGVNVIDVAADAVVAKEAVGGVNVMDVAAEAVVANDADSIVPPILPAATYEAVTAYEDESALIAQLAVPKVEPLCVPMNDPVNDPVFTVNVIEVAAEAVVAKEAVGGINVIDVAADAVVAKEADTGTKVIDVAALAVVTNDAVPNNEPVYELAETFP